MDPICRGIKRGKGGSAIRTAVASTVLVNTNEPGRLDENTAKVVAPFSPDTSDVTSVATVGFLKLQREEHFRCLEFLRV